MLFWLPLQRFAYRELMHYVSRPSTRPSCLRLLRTGTVLYARNRLVGLRVEYAHDLRDHLLV